MTPHALVTRIDLSRHVRRLRILTWVDRVLVFVSIKIVMVVGVNVFSSTHNFDDADETVVFLLQLVLIALTAWIVTAGMRNMGTISSRGWKTFKWLLLATLLAGILGVLVGAILKSPLDGEGPDYVAGYYVMGASGFIFVAALFGLAAVQGLQRMPLPAIGMGLGQLARSMADDGNAALELIRFWNLRPSQSLKGIAYALTGGALLVFSVYLFAATTIGNEPFYDFLNFLGLFCLARMRRYFQVDARSLLSVDKRRPILFLRSFEDEEVPSALQTVNEFFNHPLEVRLSRHFMHFGPFIAIGAPDDELVHLGAARAKVPDAEWQKQVRRWMGDAQIVLVYCGKTFSVNWELSMLAQRNRMHKVIMFFPPYRGWWFPFSKAAARDVGARLVCARAALKDSLWSEALESIQPQKTLRALVFGAGGSVVAIHCRSKQREAYHLAVLVAHRIVRDQPAPPTLCLRTSQGTRRWPIHGSTRIGASPNSDVVLDRDDAVSHHHARIETGLNGIYLVDLGSTNGTFVNDTRLRDSRCPVRPGDVIRIGRSVLELRHS